MNKVYLAAEYGWTLNPDATPLEDFFGIIESQQAKSEPVVAGGKHDDLILQASLHVIRNTVRRRPVEKLFAGYPFQTLVADILR